MATIYKSRGIHTSPKTAGEQNMKGVIMEKAKKDEFGINAKIKGAMLNGMKNGYKGCWTEDEFRKSVADFFDFCIDNDLKPTAPLLRLWLGVTAETIITWRNNSSRYGYKSEIINLAYSWMEAYLQNQIDKYPTGSMFLLKTTHKHVEQSKLDITTDGRQLNGSVEEVNDLVAKLGLGDSPKALKE